MRRSSHSGSRRRRGKLRTLVYALLHHVLLRFLIWYSILPLPLPRHTYTWHSRRQMVPKCSNSRGRPSPCDEVSTVSVAHWLGWSPGEKEEGEAEGGWCSSLSFFDQSGINKLHKIITIKMHQHMHFKGGVMMWWREENSQIINKSRRSAVFILFYYWLEEDCSQRSAILGLGLWIWVLWPQYFF